MPEHAISLQQHIFLFSAMLLTLQLRQKTLCCLQRHYISGLIYDGHMLVGIAKQVLVRQGTNTNGKRQLPHSYNANSHKHSLETHLHMYENR